VGFFFQNDVVTAPATAVGRHRAVPAETQLNLFSPNARGCDACPLKNKWHRLSSPRMPATGNGDILILGEAPGENEDQQNTQFIGNTGKLLRSVIPGREFDRLVWQNTVRCRPPENRDPSPREAHACSVYLEQDIAEHKIKAVLGVGGVPLRRYFDGSNITRIHGTRFPVQIGEQTLWYYPVLHPSFVLRGGGDRSTAYPVFRADIRSFFKQVDKWPKPSIAAISKDDVLLPKSAGEALSIIERMREPLGVDIETSALRPHLVGAKIITAAISDGKLTCAWPIEHPECTTDWGLDLLLYTTSAFRWIAHNAAFEYSWFVAAARQRGIDYEPAPFDDTMAQVRLYHERETLLDLNTASRIHLGVAIKGLTGVSAKQIMAYPLTDVLPYNGLDALASALIFRKLNGKVKKESYHRILESVVSTSEMELAGLPIDLEKAKLLDIKWTDKAIQAKAAAKTIYEVRAFEQARQTEWRISAPDDVGAALAEYGRLELKETKGGKHYSTGDQELHKASPDHPLIKAVLEFRNAAKMRSTYISPILSAAKLHADGLIHPGYTTMLTATLRLSSETPNIQNFPKRTKEGRELREMVVAGPGLVLVSFDFKQLEVRIEACAARDNALCNSIIRGEDIHAIWRDKILDIYPDYWNRIVEKSGESVKEKILKVGRDLIKSDFVFASFYGATVRSCAERTGLPFPIMQEVSNEFWSMFAGVRAWIKGQRREYADTGSVRTLTGLTRHQILPGQEVINTPIQGTAAAAVLEAQNAMSQMALKERDPFLHPRINIHDDLTFLLPDDGRLPQYIKLIGETMVKCRFDWQIVPLAVDCTIGTDWANMEYVSSFTGDYMR
jgi:uracil-DNA glycosylase family 4